MKVECPRCHTRVEKPLQGEPVCPTCGFGAAPAETPVGTPGGSSATGAAGSTGLRPAGAGSTGAAASGVGEGAGHGLSATAGATSGQAATPAAGGAWGSPEGWNAAATRGPNQTLAVVALVLGIVGCCVFIGIASIPAIIVGAMALKRIKDDPQEYGGHGMALTGLILGIIGVVAGIIMMVVLFATIIPLIEFCEENPDHPDCEGINDANLDAAHAAAAWLPLPVHEQFARPWSLIPHHA